MKKKNTKTRMNKVINDENEKLIKSFFLYKKRISLLYPTALSILQLIQLLMMNKEQKNNIRMER